jgi:hypothetical protein
VLATLLVPVHGFDRAIIYESCNITDNVVVKIIAVIRTIALPHLFPFRPVGGDIAASQCLRLHMEGIPIPLGAIAELA